MMHLSRLFAAYVLFNTRSLLNINMNMRSHQNEHENLPWTPSSYPSRDISSKDPMEYYGDELEEQQTCVVICECLCSQLESAKVTFIAAYGVLT